MFFKCPECGVGTELQLLKATEPFKYHCQKCGEPLQVTDNVVTRSGEARSAEIDFKRMLRSALKGDPRDDVVEEVVTAAAYVLQSGYCDFPVLAKLADDHGYLCPWDGRLHRNPECDELARKFREENPET